MGKNMNIFSLAKITKKEIIMKKFVYMFSEGNANMRELLGGKGANLAEMKNLGMPVPSGFTISTEACTNYYENGEKISEEIKSQILEALSKQEKESGKIFGDEKNPLLVSVRSGARVSMPGMMDTILNLGLNDKTVEVLAKNSNNSRFAYDCYRRFIQMYGDVALGVDGDKFEKIIEEVKEKNHIKLDIELDQEALKEIIVKYKNVIKETLGYDFPQDPKEQLFGAVKAVFASWENPRAVVYRKLNQIPASWGTAVNIQEMVFGNLNEKSGTGVAFSRDPSSGEDKIYGEFMFNAQGEDIVAGIRTPLHIEELANIMPDVYNQFVSYAKALEKHYKDMQDMEFTVENGKLFLLQTRNGKRTAKAALQIAVDMVNEGLKSKEEALVSLDPRLLDTMLHRQFDDKALKQAKAVANGLPASPGAACGKLVLNSDDAKIAKEHKVKTVLVRLETSAKDIEGMTSAEGILTARGGMTSHAAVVARGLGAPCVVGCEGLVVNEEEKYITLNGQRVNEGEIISVDGATGNVYIGEIATVPAKMSDNFALVMKWAKEIKKIGVRANADTPLDAQTAVDFGAEGIGLVRTEHMFFKPNKILAIREMIVAQNLEAREKALEKLLPMQMEDFVGIFEALNGLPCTIRLIDPPLHEFLPKERTDQEILAKSAGISLEKLQEIIKDLAEFNPMMGHRGCRLAVTYPEIARMQTKAILLAAIKVKKEKGIDVKPEIMIPLTCEEKELDYVKNEVEQTAKNVLEEAGINVDYKIGTMIEVPRAAIIADRLAERAEFFSFGTNDLTQMTFGFSRDDAGKFISDYYSKKLLDYDPFVRVDEKGVGALIKMAVEKGRQVKPNLKIGVCGEQGSNPESVEFFYKNGISYVSCSPYRIPMAILSGAIATIKNK